MNSPIEKLEASNELAANRLRNDKRIAEAKKLLLEAVNEQSRQLTGIKPPCPELKKSYEELLAAFAQYRGGPLWYPYIGSGIGNGALVELLDGSVKYDFITGIGPHFWGHSHPDLIEAGIDAALSNTLMQGHLQQNADSLKFCQLMVEISGLDHCFLTTSGAMANENGLKIAFQKKAPATRLLAFERCFAGRTLAFSQVTDKPAFREGLPSNLFVDYLPFYDPARPEESCRNAAALLKKYLARYPGQHAAMIFELVQGEAGSYPGSHPFFHALMTLLKEAGIAIIIDEIQTFGRTLQPFAFQHFQLQEFADIVTVGKMSQVCATLFRKEYTPRPGLLSQTFTASTAALRGAYVLVRGLIDEGFFGSKGKIAALHTYFCRELKLLEEEGLISGPFGIGAMVAFTPRDGTAKTAAAIARNLFDAGVISFTAGSHPTRIRFLMPVGAIGEKEIAEVASIIKKTVSAYVPD